MSGSLDWSDLASRVKAEHFRRYLAGAGVFLIAFEMMRKSIVDRPLHFFSSGIRDGKIPTSSSYKEKVLECDPSDKRDALRGSISWFRSMDALTEIDVDKFYALSRFRNKLVHETHDVIFGTQNIAEVLENKIDEVIELSGKFDRWWIYNIEIATDPDISDDETKIDGIIPGPQIFLKLFKDAAMSENEELANAYHTLVSFAEEMSKKAQNPPLGQLRRLPRPIDRREASQSWLLRQIEHDLVDRVDDVGDAMIQCW